MTMGMQPLAVLKVGTIQTTTEMQPLLPKVGVEIQDFGPGNSIIEYSSVERRQVVMLPLAGEVCG